MKLQWTCWEVSFQVSIFFCYAYASYEHFTYFPLGTGAVAASLAISSYSVHVNFSLHFSSLWWVHKGSLSVAFAFSVFTADLISTFIIPWFQTSMVTSAVPSQHSMKDDFNIFLKGKFSLLVLLYFLCLKTLINTKTVREKF